jgi:plasmid rolling circle replication initiator protein Rep
MRTLAGVEQAPSPSEGILAPIAKLSSRRQHTQTVGRALGRDPMTRDVAQRIGNCSLRLALALEQQDDGAARALITSGMFCQARLCPICEWRRTRAWRGRLTAGLGRFAEKYPTHRALFLTLTVRNVPIHQTRDTIKELHAGFRSLTRLQHWPTPFWLRRTEVTIGNPSFQDDLPTAKKALAAGNPHLSQTSMDGADGAVASPYGLWAHPHIHSLLMVPASYFGRNYRKQSWFQKEWALALGLDYAPVVDVRKTTSKEGSPVLADAAQDAVMEAAKYITKANDISKLGPLAGEMHMQLKGQRMIQLSQALGKFVKDGDIQAGEYLDGAEVDVSQNPMFHTVVEWDSLLSQYTIAP